MEEDCIRRRRVGAVDAVDAVDGGCSGFCKSPTTTNTPHCDISTMPQRQYQLSRHANIAAPLLGSTMSTMR